MEQSYKEKYERALAKAKEQYNYPCMRSCMGILEDIFPELAESEDEKVIKEIIELVMQPTWKTEEEFHRRNVLCAWLENVPVTIYHEKREGFHLGYKACLERQGEQEKDILEDAILDGYILDDDEDGLIAATIEYSKKKPKFKIGDFIANDYCFGKVIALTDDAYLLDTEQGVPFSCEHNVHLWTIDDAKDGDVLYINNTVSESIIIYKSFNNRLIKKYASYNKFGFEGEHYLTLNDGYIVPATKEQRELLFTKMKEAGYTFDFEKKELKKIEDEHQLKEGKFYECIKSYHYLGGGQYWFEKGSVYFCEKDGYLRLDSNNNIYVYDCKNWQSYFRPYAEKLAWSEEDECYMTECINAIATKDSWSFEEKRKTKHWVKSLKQRIGG